MWCLRHAGEHAAYEREVQATWPEQHPEYASTMLPPQRDTLQAPITLAPKKQFMRDAQDLIASAKLSDEMDKGTLEKIEALLEELDS